MKMSVKLLIPTAANNDVIIPMEVTPAHVWMAILLTLTASLATVKYNYRKPVVLPLYPRVFQIR